jgi:hypothetical protein
MLKASLFNDSVHQIAPFLFFIHELCGVSKFKLVHAWGTFGVPDQVRVLKCGLPTDDPAVAGAPDSVRAVVSVGDFRQLVLALEDKGMKVTNANLGGFSLLCDELCFAALSQRLLAFRQFANFKEVGVMEDSQAQR